MSSESTLTQRSSGSGTRLFSLDRFLPRCSSPQCPERDRFWPQWRRKSVGIEFEGQWFCSARCAQRTLESVFHQALWRSGQGTRKRHRVPLGLLLLSRGAISSDQLQEALRLQRERGYGKLGYWLRETGAINEKQLARALAVQWSCPVFPLEGHQSFLRCARLLPFALVESERLLPVHYNETARLLYLAIADHVDHTLLYAIEQMLGCRTVACVAVESGVLDGIEQIRRDARAEETLFDSVREPRDMARTTLNYAETLGAAQLVVVAAGAYLWVRFRRTVDTRDLLFQVVSTKSGKAIPY